MARPRQLTLDLGVPTARSRLTGTWRRGWRPLLRVLVSLAAALVLSGVALQLVPYRATVAGVQVEADARVTVRDRGLTVDSSLGSLRFRTVTALPVGLRVTPRVDLDAVRAATGAGTDFTDRARRDLQAQVPGLVLHFASAALAGLLVGALVGGLVLDGLLLLVVRDEQQRFDTRRRGRLAETGVRVALVSAVAALATVGVAGASYRSDWSSRYTVTGLLADVAATPARLAQLDARDVGAADKVRAVLRLQDALTRPPVDRATPPAAYRVMFISDVHRRTIYPYLQQYVDANDVALIVNTGDETLVGQPAELTPDYLAAIAAVTARTPMVWVKGNHDSDAVAAAMDAVPGVTVLDGQVLSAYGLQLYGTADPRTYGAPGAAGSDDPGVVTRVETAGAVAALGGLNAQTYLDLLLAHEPVEADVMARTLGASVRAQASGHVHRQNPDSDLQAHDRAVRLVEGSTGLGGLLADAGDPMAFSILSVAADCQYTRVVRYQLADPALPTADDRTSYGDSSSFVVHYFDPQPISPDRTCSRAAGVGSPVDAGSPVPYTVSQWGAGSPSAPSPVVTPSPVSPRDEQGDATVTGTPAPSAAPPAAPQSQP